jgi:hypothetical protein
MICDIMRLYRCFFSSIHIARVSLENNMTRREYNLKIEWLFALNMVLMNIALWVGCIGLIK